MWRGVSIILQGLTAFWLLCQRGSLAVRRRQWGRARPRSTPRPVRLATHRSLCVRSCVAELNFFSVFSFSKNDFISEGPLFCQSSPVRPLGRLCRHCGEGVAGSPQWLGVPLCTVQRHSPCTPSPLFQRSGGPPLPLLITLFSFAPGSMGRLYVDNTGVMVVS